MKKSLFGQKLAELDLECEIARLWGYRLAWMEDKGLCPNYAYAMCKLHRDRVMQSAPVLFMQLAGLNGQFEPGSKYAVLGGAVISIYETMTRMTNLGGTREIMKNIVALRALGLPHGQGSATPYHDPKLSGSVEGASAWTTS